jgi:hypothetical protein
MTLGLESEWNDIIVLHDGTTMTTHGRARCALEHCCIHNPSDHPLRNAPLSWLKSINLMLRICPCSQPHPDPDSMDWLRSRFMPYDMWHPCCEQRCCLTDAERDAEDHHGGDPGR